MDISSINLNNELTLGKNSILKEIIFTYLEDYYSKTESYLLMNSILEEITEELQNKPLISGIENGISLVMTRNEFTAKLIIDNILNIKLEKNEKSIPLDFLSFYDKTIIMIALIEKVINLVENRKIILLVDGLDNRLTNKQIEKIYTKLEKISQCSMVNLYIFSNNKMIINKENNILKTLIINEHDSIVYLDNLEDLTIKISQIYPTVLPYEKLLQKIKKAIINNLEYIGNFVQITDSKIYDLKEITIIKIINDIFDFKYTISLENTYLNNRFYSYLTSNI